jgi:hypothetical protein
MINAERRNGENDDSLNPHTPKSDIPIWFVSCNIIAITVVVMIQITWTIHLPFCQAKLLIYYIWRHFLLQ